MKLAIVSPYPPEITGIGQYGYHISRLMARSGQFKQITVLAGSRLPASANGSVPALKVKYAWRPDQLSVGPAILKALQQEKPDLVWLNVGASVFGRSPLANFCGFFSLLPLRSLGLPTAVTLHELVELADLKSLHAPGGRLALYGARLLTRMAIQADVVCLTIGRYVNWISLQHPRLPCVHIPIGAYQTPERLPDASSPELLYFASLAPYKGIEVLLDAFSLLREKMPGLRLTIAGAEHPRFPGYLEALRREYGWLPGVHWIGHVPEEQIRDLFARVQLVVLPYLASTGSSSVLYQAAVWGRALVVSDLPELRAAAGESGLEVTLFKNRDAPSLAAAIQELLDSPGRRCAQAEHNFYAIQHRPPEATGYAYLRAFNLALEARRSPKRIDVPAIFTSEAV